MEKYKVAAVFNMGSTTKILRVLSSLYPIGGVGGAALTFTSEAKGPHYASDHVDG